MRTGLSNRAAILVISVVVALAYAPTWLAHYAFADDYSLLDQSQHGSLYYYQQIIAAGRSLSAIGLRFMLHFSRTVNSLEPWHLISVAGIVFTSCLAWLALSRRGLSPVVALAVSLFLCSLPAFQVYAAWGVAFLYPWGCVLGGLAVFVLDGYLWMSLRTWPRYVIGGLLLLAGLQVYQSAALFYWVFVGISLLVAETTALEFGRAAVRYIVVAAASLVAEFILATALPAAIHDPVSMASHKKLLAVGQIGAKARWFFGHPLRDSLNLVVLLPRDWIAVLVALFITAGLLLYLRDTPWVRVGKVAVAWLALPVAYLPNLVIALDAPAYRAQAPLVGLIGLYFCLAVVGMGRGRWRPLVPAALSIVAVVAVGIACYNVLMEFAVPQAVEYAVLASDLRPATVAHATSVYFIPPTWQDRVAPFIRTDEFGEPSSLPTWNDGPMVYVVLHATDPAKDNIPVTVDTTPKADPPNGALVVDMSTLWQYRLP